MINQPSNDLLKYVYQHFPSLGLVIDYMPTTKHQIWILIELVTCYQKEKGL